MGLNQKSLRAETNRWVRDGLVTQEQAEKILGLYPASPRNYAFIAFAVIGSVLLLTGIILILSSNWRDIPNEVKFAGLLMLMAGSWVLGIESQRRNWPRAWWECAYLAAAIFPLLGMMLISQIFHIQGEPKNLLLAWTAAITPLPIFSRSVSTFVIWIIALLNYTWFQMDFWEWIHDFDSFVLTFMIFGLALAALSQLWILLGERTQRNVGEFWGLFIALIMGYAYGFREHLWLLVWFLEFLFCLGMIYRGYRCERANQVNLGFVMVALLILSVFFRLAGTMMDTGLLFIVGGIVMLAVVYGINRLRRQVLRKMA